MRCAWCRRSGHDRWEARPAREDTTRHEDFVAERNVRSDEHRFVSFLSASRQEMPCSVSPYIIDIIDIAFCYARQPWYGFYESPIVIQWRRPCESYELNGHGRAVKFERICESVGFSIIHTDLPFNHLKRIQQAVTATISNFCLLG